MGSRASSSERTLRKGDQFPLLQPMISKKWRHFLWGSGIFVVLLFGTCGRSSVSYSAICAQCLQHARGVEKELLGFPYYSRQRLSQNPGGLMSPAIFSPPVAQIDPAIYEQIFGRPCEHFFVRGGFCRYSWGMVGCGSHGAARQFGFRDALIEQLYRAYPTERRQGLGARNVWVDR